ncbi:MAG TPA: hypothetical protein VFA74_09250 [Terriglobales bacterium]|nr:hypothetical protein [Terriglobales bacterium]
MNPEVKRLLEIVASRPADYFVQFEVESHLKGQATAFRSLVRLGFVSKDPIARKFVTDVANTGYTEDETQEATLRRASLQAAELLWKLNTIQAGHDRESAKRKYVRENEDFDPFLQDCNLDPASLALIAPEAEQTTTFDRFGNIQQQ